VIGPADSVPVLAIGLVTKDFKVSASIRSNSWMVGHSEATVLEPAMSVELLANLHKVALVGYIPELGTRPVPHLRQKLLALALRTQANHDREQNDVGDLESS
jgi:hypothetical protein